MGCPGREFESSRSYHLLQWVNKTGKTARGNWKKSLMHSPLFRAIPAHAADHPPLRGRGIGSGHVREGQYSGARNAVRVIGCGGYALRQGQKP